MRVTSKTGSVGASKPVGALKPVSKPASDGPLPVSTVQSLSSVDDAMRVSGTAQFIAVARAKIASVPDIRSAKVDAIRAKLDKNNYHPDGEAVADGLVREHTPPHPRP